MRIWLIPYELLKVLKPLRVLKLKGNLTLLRGKE